MARKNVQEVQENRDVDRAQSLVSRVRGLSRSESAAALRRRASEIGVSLHAAALAVLASSPVDDLLVDAPRD